MSKKPSLAQRAKFLISVMFNYALRRAQFNPIIENETRDEDHLLGNIYLGAMPMKKVAGRKRNHHIDVIKSARKSGRPLGHVIGAIEKHENKRKTTRVLRPVKPRHWSERGITFQRVNVPDYSTKVDNKDILDAVKNITATRIKGQSVYVHCKAGRSRSVLILMCYLTTEYRNAQGQALSYEEAYALIKNKRTHIDFAKPRKRQAVKDFIQFYNQIKIKNEKLITRARDNRSPSQTIPGSSLEQQGLFAVRQVIGSAPAPVPTGISDHSLRTL